MVSKKKLTSLDFETIEDYYNEIFESRCNGQLEQVREMVNQLSAKERACCRAFLETSLHYDLIDQAPRGAEAYLELYRWFKECGLVK